MKIAIGCDHAGYQTKTQLIKVLESKGYEIIDCGTYNENTSTHYPIYGYEVGRQVATKKAVFGIVLCGSGIGITNAANKVQGVRACLAESVSTALIAKKYYNANVIGIGARVLGIDLITEIVLTFVNKRYDGSHKDEIKKIDAVIQNKNHQSDFFMPLIKKWETGKYTKNVKQEKIPIPKTFKK